MHRKASAGAAAPAAAGAGGGVEVGGESTNHPTLTNQYHQPGLLLHQQLPAEGELKVASPTILLYQTGGIGFQVSW